MFTGFAVVINGFETRGVSQFCQICFYAVKAISETGTTWYIMLDHTAKAATDLSLSSIIYKNDKLNKAKHYIITYIEHVKLPKLKSLPMKDLWREKNGEKNIILPGQSTRNGGDISSRPLLSAWSKALCSATLLVRFNSYKTALFM